MTIIRKAVPQDTDDLCRMALDFYRETRYSNFVEADLGSFIDTITDLVSFNEGVVLVAENDGKVCGMIGCAIVEPWFNKKHRLAQELFWWIDAEYRNTGAGKLLLDQVEEWAKESGCNAICLCRTVLNNASVTEKLGVLYEKNGYELRDYLHVKVV